MPVIHQLLFQITEGKKLSLIFPVVLMTTTHGIEKLRNEFANF